MLKAISLFTGIGGLDFGFEAAGFDTRVAVEFDATACRTLRLNRPWTVIEGDINSVSSEEILRAAKLRVGEADVLIGGPPCQPFSKASYWVRGDSLRLDDPRAGTLGAYLRVLRDTQPRSFLIENVSGIAYKGKDEGLKLILAGVDQINRETGSNYRVAWKVINTAEHGVPQTRERAFLVASRDGTEFQFPRPAFGPSADGSHLFENVQPYRTAWDALGDLPEPPRDAPGLRVGGKWGELLPSIPEGENYLWHTARGGGLPLFGWRTRYWSFLLKLSKRLPSWTIQAQPGSSIGPFHWNNRKLTFAELCRLQTFPDGLTVDTGRTEMQRMLGNAVPSLIGEVLAREIRSQFLASTLNTPLTLLPPRRDIVPEPVRVHQVPSQYLALAGHHAEHPGTGKGNRAKLLAA